MQARLEIKRSPSIIVAVLFALAAALLLGGSLGYALRPATVVSGPTHYVVVPAAQSTSANAADDSCQFLSNHHKAC